MFKRILFILLIVSFSIKTYADTYHYRVDVEGMVCAFCAYNVESEIRKLPSVDVDSINVSLKNNFIKFSSQQKISQQKLSNLFKESGFTLSNLTISTPLAQEQPTQQRAKLEVSIDVFETDQFTSLLKTIGDIATRKPSRLRIEAPQEQENTILKALLMGKQQLIQVFFIPNETTDVMHLQLFDAINAMK